MGIWVNSVKGFCQNIHYVILICRWQLPASYNRNLFASIFPAFPVVFGTTMQSLKSWCFHKASSDVFRGVWDISNFKQTSTLQFLVFRENAKNAEK